MKIVKRRIEKNMKHETKHKQKKSKNKNYKK
jgi:hypothetical protein